MPNNVFPKSMQRPGRSKIETTTLHGFGGGWNAVDDDYSMAPRYCKSLVNFNRSPSGGQKLRYGTGFHVDIKSVRNSPILDQEYFNGRLVCVTESGNIVTVTEGGTITEIWNSTIAAALPGAPATWSTGLTQVTFVPFKNTLIIHNGVDKPIQVSSAFAVTYLQDGGTGSNVNVPIGKYACVAANYHCIAGIPSNPTEIVISAAGTAGTFPGDPDPNDSISIDVGAYAPEGAAAIRGIAGYRTNLIVFLQGVSIQITLGEYVEGTHTPRFPDTFPKFGLVGDRCVTTIENDLVFVGLGGLSSAKRNMYTQGTLDAAYISNIIEPEYRRLLAMLSDTEQLLTAFTVYDPLQRNLMIFTKDGEALVYTSNEKLNYKGWSKFIGMNYRCGCTSFLGRVYLASGTRIFQLGNKTFNEEYTADRVNDRDANWAANTNFAAETLLWDTVTEETYRVLVTHTTPPNGTFAEDRNANPTNYELYEGIPIEFELEMPWFTGKDPMKLKHMKYIGAGTNGIAEFTVEAYVDNLYKDYDGNVIYDPALSMVFAGNDIPGFGIYTDVYGGGRRSNSPLLYKFPLKFKAVKFRIFGSTVHPLELTTFSFLFARGRYFR